MLGRSSAGSSLQACATLGPPTCSLVSVLYHHALCRFLDVLGPGPLYVGLPSSDAVTKHLADTLKGSGAVVRNDVKVSLT